MCAPYLFLSLLLLCDMQVVLTADIISIEESGKASRDANKAVTKEDKAMASLLTNRAAGIAVAGEDEEEVIAAHVGPVKQRLAGAAACTPAARRPPLADRSSGDSEQQAGSDEENSSTSGSVRSKPCRKRVKYAGDGDDSRLFEGIEKMTNIMAASTSKQHDKERLQMEKRESAARIEAAAKGAEHSMRMDVERLAFKREQLLASTNAASAAAASAKQLADQQAQSQAHMFAMLAEMMKSRH